MDSASSTVSVGVSVELEVPRLIIGVKRPFPSLIPYSFPNRPRDDEDPGEDLSTHLSGMGHDVSMCPSSEEYTEVLGVETRRETRGPG